MVIQAAHECSSRYAQPSNSSGYHHGIIPTQLYEDCKKNNIIRIPIKQIVSNNPGKKKQQAYLKVSKVAERTLRRVASVNLPGLFFSTNKIGAGKMRFFFDTKAHRLIDVLLGKWRFSLWDGRFSGAMLTFKGVNITKQTIESLGKANLTMTLSDGKTFEISRCQKKWCINGLWHTVKRMKGRVVFSKYNASRKINMSPKKGPFKWKGLSSNHYFSGDMLNFRGGSTLPNHS